MVLIKSSQKAKTFSFCFLLHSFLLPLFCSKCCLLNFNSHPPSTHFHTFTFFGLLGFTQSSAFRISSSTPGSLSHTFTFFSPRVLLRVLPCVSSDILIQLFKKINHFRELHSFCTRIDIFLNHAKNGYIQYYLAHHTMSCARAYYFLVFVFVSVFKDLITNWFVCVACICICRANHRLSIVLSLSVSVLLSPSVGICILYLGLYFCFCI